MHRREERRQQQRLQNNGEELIERMARALPEDGTREAFPGFRISRSEKPLQSVPSVYEPAFCFVAQGRKRALLGEEVFRYDPFHYLLFTVDLPIVFQIEEASKERPYLRCTST